MARYYRISPRIWADNAWSETARLLALYLRRDRSTVHSAPPVRGTAGGRVESGEKAEPPSSSLGGSAGHHEPPVTPTPGRHSKASPVESPNRRERVS
jgi:hypothetical protein